MTASQKLWWKESGSIFLMTEGWDSRMEKLKEYFDLLRGSLTLHIESFFEVGIQSYTNY